MKKIEITLDAKEHLATIVVDGSKLFDATTQAQNSCSLLQIELGNFDRAPVKCEINTSLQFNW